MGYSWIEAHVIPDHTSDLDLMALKLILAQVISFSGPCRNHLLPGTDVVVIVALIGGCRTPDFVKAPQHYLG